MISERLKKVILKELGLDDFEFDTGTTADQIPGWDSLSHINIIASIENEYGLRFNSSEILRCQNVADLQSLVESKSKG